ncbi:WXG100 family type VII secretion target [Kutzneria buriramensis]|uniref:ESAT-6-like protein n=1 Tax=Kutzneria buriramensis TaxID=1045776 RepID=A0A3E0IA40_9PSEU|nr:WXG100 family type VII secretion target [Kutzneria buriramensis]REH55540.1 WXG100 family type VII secretion target [Kutzneria buriramensis]
MSAGYGTNFAEMASCAKDIESVEQEINGAVNKLNSDLEPLKASWQGQASAAFQQLQERLMEDAKKLNQALSDISNAMKTASGTYQQQEEEAHRGISNIASRLGG